MDTIFFDHISGTPLHPEVREVMVRHLQESYGNPTSQHSVGIAAQEALEEARGRVAGLVNAPSSSIVFTSGGTEAVNHAIKGVALSLRDKGRHIVTSNIEHSAVARSLRLLMRLGYRVTSLPVDRHGLVDPGDVAKAIASDTILVTVMHANNEIGTIEPIAEIGRITRERGALFHTDAVASVGVIPFDVEEMGVDLASMAANQFYGPHGVGALYIRPKTRIMPFIDGGIQEYNLRAGTQNMAGIVGMGKAAELAKRDMPARIAYVRDLRELFLARLADMEAMTVNGHPTRCLPHLVSFSVGYVEGESMMLLLDEKGICISTRSACATGSLRASHVLLAIGCDYASAQGTLIFSFGIGNTKEELNRAFGVFTESVAFLRNISPLYRKKR